MAMSYIAVVNPRILSAASAVTPDDPFPFRSVVSATCLTAMVAGVSLVDHLITRIIELLRLPGNTGTFVHRSVRFTFICMYR